MRLLVLLLAQSGLLRRFGCRLCLAEFNEGLFHEVVKKMEQDIRDFAHEVERVYLERCNDETTLSASCVNANYVDCLSVFPQGTCHGGLNLNVKECLGITNSSSFSCSALYDYSTSNVRIPSHYLYTPFSTFSAADDAIATTSVNATMATTIPAWTPNAAHANPAIVPTICWTRLLEDWLIQKRLADYDAFWRPALNGDAPRSMYYSDAATGLVRIYPARHDDECGTYDPRLRPWYIAASSGPKNVMLILDISGSMNTWRLGHVKKAAIRILYTLTAQDYFNIVVFENTARVLDVGNNGYTNSSLLVAVTEESVKQFEAAILALEVGTATNFLDAFATAFDVLDASVQIEGYACSSSRQSNTAILFLTDGKMTTPSNDTAPVVELVLERMAALSDQLNLVLFTYSLDDNSESDIHAFPAQLACAVNALSTTTNPSGVYTKITVDQDITDSLASYHELFALGLANSNFTAWVKPYPSSIGNRETITVSAPVYDRKVATQPRFLGVVAMNFDWTAFVTALGGGSSTTEVERVENEKIHDLVQKSTSQCPRLDLSACQLELYRRLQGDGSNCSSTNVSEALCATDSSSSNSADVIALNHAVTTSLDALGAGACPGVDYPQLVWNNTDNADRSYVERTCCSPESQPMLTNLPEQCPRPVYNPLPPIESMGTTSIGTTDGTPTTIDKSSGTVFYRTCPQFSPFGHCFFWLFIVVLLQRL